MSKNILETELYSKLKMKEKILFMIFRKYTYQIFSEGIKTGFNLR